MSANLKRELEPLLCGRMGHPLRHLDSVGSTNVEALAWAASGAPEGAVVVADEQLAGRGRWGRTWLSGRDASLTFSLVLRPSLGGAGLGLLPLTLGVATADAIEELTALPVSLKWPNDVTYDGRKLAGILVETRLEGASVTSAIAGIGVNLGWRPDDVPAAIADSATSLAIELGGDAPSRASLLAAILSWFEPLYDSIVSGSGAEEIVRRASARSELLGDDILIRFPDGRESRARALQLLPSGALEVDVEGRRVALDAGEIERIRRT
ncbi:MAG: biotin--[acetyl-CoA-carboxylase] ligase [Actinomycetota bacterium]